MTDLAFAPAGGQVDRTIMNRNIFGAAIAAMGLSIAVSGFGGAASAQSGACGGPYVVQQNETIYSIASKTYETVLHRQLLVNLLAREHGAADRVLPAGGILTLPCPTPTGFSLNAIGLNTAKAKPVEVLVTTAGYEYSKAVAMVGPVSIYEALLDSVMRHGGMVPEFRTLSKAETTASARPLGANSLGDLSFPWSPTDCAAGGGVCEQMLWSDPLFELTSTAYAAPGGPNWDAAENAALCIAKDSLGAVKHASPVYVEAAKDAVVAPTQACIAALRSGEVQIAILPDVSVAMDYRLNPSAPRLAAAGPQIGVTMHAVVNRSTIGARRIISRVNAALEHLRVSGEWYDVVRVQMSRNYLN